MQRRALWVLCMTFAVATTAFGQAGLVAHWPLDGDGRDISGNGNDLTISGAAPGTDRFGTPGMAIDLDPSTSSLSLADGPATDLTTQFTWAGWVRFDRIGSTNDGFFSKSCCSTNVSTMVYADTYAWDGSRPYYDQIRFFVSAGADNFGFEHAGPILQNHVWYHIALVYHGPSRTMKVYVNGTLTDSLTNTGAGGIADVPSSLNNCDPPLSMGRFPDPGPTATMSGALDDVWWFARALTAPEIAALVNAPPLDTTPPAIRSVTASPNVIWPPNHQMIPVAITVDAVDQIDPHPVNRIVAVSSSDLTASSADWQITGPLTLDVRAERTGKNGRVYTVVVESRDASGNASLGTVHITVPHDQGKP